ARAAENRDPPAGVDIRCGGWFAGLSVTARLVDLVPPPSGSSRPPRRPTHERSPSTPLALESHASLRDRLVARDERALVELIETTTPWLLALVQGMLRDQDEAEEVVLETFRIAWDRVAALGDEHEGLMPWLFRVARNRA